MRRPLTILLLAAILVASSPAVASSTATEASAASATDTRAPEPTATTPAESEAAPTIQALENSLAFVEVGDVNAYPGPVHYAGDVLTFEIRLDEFADAADATATLTLDGGAPIEVSGTWNYNVLLLPLALDTSGLEGEHQVDIQAAGDDRPRVNVHYEFNVLPAEQRPLQEVDAEWLMAASECCTIYYLSNSAAARDIEAIVAASDTAFAQLEDLMGSELDGSLDIWLLDRMWGNGAFGGGGELASTYTDRNYGPAQGEAGLLTLFRHEFTHAAGLDTSQTLGEKFYFTEGIAVYLAGGHYKPEPLEARSAAMQALNYGSALQPSFSNHEVAYLQMASMVAYLVDTYGWDSFWAFRDQAVFETWSDEAQRETITQEALGVSYAEFRSEYTAWLGSHDAGDQTEDLRLSVELQDLRRDYQKRFSPEPIIIFGRAEVSYGVPEYAPIVMRENSLPANVAMELMIANGQKAIAAGEYAAAEALVDAITAVLRSRSFSDPLASYYASAVEFLAGEGYLVQGLTFDGDAADVVASLQAPDLVELRIELVNGAWQLAD